MSKFLFIYSSLFYFCSMDNDPNQLAFGLECLHCNTILFSQGSLRRHTKHQTKCKNFCIKCGCCRNVFVEKLALALHLNQPGVKQREAARSPSDYMTVSIPLATTATTTTTTTSVRVRALTPRMCSSIPTAKDLRPPTRPFRPLRVNSRTGRLISETSVATDWHPVDVHQSWLDQALGPSMPTLPEVPCIQHFEVISPVAYTSNTDAFPPGNTLTQLVAPTKPLNPRPAAASSPDSTDVEPEHDLSHP